MIEAPDDQELTVQGLPPSGGGRILIVACGALAHEIVALRKRNDWQHLDLTCLPAILHNTPDQIPDAVERVVTENRARYDQIFVLYADCGTGGLLEQRCRDLGVQMMPGPHCYAFFQGVTDFLDHSADEFDAFYLTDFLVRQFDAFVWRPLGLDRHPQLRDTYFQHYQKLVYLAQTDQPDLDSKARDIATRMGLTYVRRATGYGQLETELAALSP